MGLRSRQNSLAVKVSMGFAILGLVFITALLINIWETNQIHKAVTHLINVRANVTEQTHENLFLGEWLLTKQRVDRLLISNWSFLIVGLLMCGILGLIIIKSFTRPIHKLVGIVNQISRGNLKQKINIKETTEFHELSIALNKMVDTFRNLSDVTSKMAVGDYSKRVEVKSQEDTLSITVNQMLDNFNLIVQQANAIAKGDFSHDIKPRSKYDVLGNSLQNMTQRLRKNKIHTEQENWLKDGLAQLTSTISGTNDIPKLCKTAINSISRYMKAAMGVIYIYDSDKKILKLTASYAFVRLNTLSDTLKLGEGIVGQAALEKMSILLNQIDDEKMQIKTGTTIQKPTEIYAFPLLCEDNLLGVVELATTTRMSNLQSNYLSRLAPLLATQILSAKQQTLTENLLDRSNSMTKKLKAQQEALQQKAKEIEKASAYKSEFLANMSHELRTPLNSLLILAKLLADNEEGNLTDDQTESSKIIYKSAQDLLVLINDILDLAKVEAGKIELTYCQTSLHQLLNQVQQDFKYMAREKNILLKTHVEKNLPNFITTDDHRIYQIIKNLLSNAIKFTSQGEVECHIYRPTTLPNQTNPALKADSFIALSVNDTGIGISEEKQKLIFNSFQQADGTTSREYGGTGLGLSISTQLASLLGGMITVESTVHSGSCFTLYLPEIPQKETTPSKKSSASLSQLVDESQVFIHPSTSPIVANRAEKLIKPLNIDLSNKKILVVDDDMRNTFALSKVLKSKGINVIMAANGKMAIETLEKQNDINMVLMDIMMPIMDGYKAVKKIRSIGAFNTLPIIALTAKAMIGDKEKCLEIGASDFIAKPIDQALLLSKIEYWLT